MRWPPARRLPRHVVVEAQHRAAIRRGAQHAHRRRSRLRADRQGPDRQRDNHDLPRQRARSRDPRPDGHGCSARTSQGAPDAFPRVTASELRAQSACAILLGQRVILRRVRQRHRRCANRPIPQLRAREKRMPSTMGGNDLREAYADVGIGRFVCPGTQLQRGGRSSRRRARWLARVELAFIGLLAFIELVPLVELFSKPLVGHDWHRVIAS